MLLTGWNGDTGSGAAMGGSPHGMLAARGLRALVVDDEPSVGRTIAYAAEACGCDAGLAISAAAFRKRYLLTRPDVVLLDLAIPGGDGIELLRFLAAEESAARIFIISGFDSRVVESAVRLGSALGLRMGGCLTKPVTVAELAEALARDVPEPAGRSDHELCSR